MSKPIQLKNRYQYLAGRDAERTFDTERLLVELGVPYTVNNREQHIIVSFEAVKMHIWSTTMKWRVGEGSVMQGTRAALRAAMLKAHKQKPVELPFKTEAELDQVKRDWLTQGYAPPQSIEGFERYQEELVAFYNRTQHEVNCRVERALEGKFEDYLSALGESFETLRLHQTMAVNDTLTVTKVTGGWIYTTQVEASSGEYEEQVVSTSVSTTFVPEITPLLS